MPAGFTLHRVTATLAIAAIGAITGCASLGWNVFTWWHAGPQLRLTVSPNMVSTEDDQTRHILVFVTNVGTLPTTLTHVFVHRKPALLRWRRKADTSFFVPDPSPQFRLPRLLSPGERWVGYLMQAGLKAAIEERRWADIRIAIYHDPRLRHQRVVRRHPDLPRGRETAVNGRSLCRRTVVRAGSVIPPHPPRDRF